MGDTKASLEGDLEGSRQMGKGQVKVDNQIEVQGVSVTSYILSPNWRFRRTEQ